MEHQMTRATEATIKAGSTVRLTPACLRAKKRLEDVEYVVTRVITYVAPNGNGTVRTMYQLHDPRMDEKTGYFTCARGSFKPVPVSARVGDKVRVSSRYLKKHPKVADEVYTVHCDFSSADEVKFILKAADGTFPWCLPAAELIVVN
jgi:hypothetical protein